MIISIYNVPSIDSNLIQNVITLSCILYLFPYINHIKLELPEAKLSINLTYGKSILNSTTPNEIITFLYFLIIIYDLLWFSKKVQKLVKKYWITIYNDVYFVIFYLAIQRTKLFYHFFFILLSFIYIFCINFKLFYDCRNLTKQKKLISLDRLSVNPNHFVPCFSLTTTHEKNFGNGINWCLEGGLIVKLNDWWVLIEYQKNQTTNASILISFSILFHFLFNFSSS